MIYLFINQLPKIIINYNTIYNLIITAKEIHIGQKEQAEQGIAAICLNFKAKTYKVLMDF